MAYMKDSAGRRLDSFEVQDADDAAKRYSKGIYGVSARDLIAHYDSSALTGPDGSSVQQWPDLARGRQAIQNTAATQPTIKLTGLNGMRTVLFSATQRIIDPTFGNDFSEPPGFNQPNTIIALVKASSTALPASAGRAIVGGSPNATTNNALMLNSNGQAASVTAGTVTSAGGPNLNDDAWHVVAGMLGASSAWTMVDGFVVARTGSQSQGVQAWKSLGLGDNANNTAPFGGEIAEVLVFNAQLSLTQANAITAGLARKWAL